MDSILSWAGVFGLAVYVVVDRLLVRAFKRWVARLVRETPSVEESTSKAVTWKQLIVLRKLEIGDSFEARIWLDHVFYIVMGVVTGVVFAIYSPPGVILSLFLVVIGGLMLLVRIRYGSQKLRDIPRLLRGDPPVISAPPQKLSLIARLFTERSGDRDK